MNLPGTVAQHLRTATVGLVMTVSCYVGTEQRDSHRMDFREISYLGLSIKFFGIFDFE
jgi:hypothetical protein